MASFLGRKLRSFLLLLLLSICGFGCLGLADSKKGLPSPVEVGLNTNDLIDPSAQFEADNLGNVKELFEYAEAIKRQADLKRKTRSPLDKLRSRRSVLCLSGGGAYGAFSAGVLCGWTARGDRPGCNGRPDFDVVTGISTGALIAPMAFLGPKYDAEVRRFYTTVDRRDIYRLRPVRGLFSIALADNGPLVKMVDQVITPELVGELAVEHGKGRRLYIGTTELEGRRFVFWDIGAIACGGDEKSRDLIKKILLGSSAIPGFFPPSRIPVDVDGKTLVEEHGDGGVSSSIFFRPPYVPQERWTAEGTDLSDVDLYMIVAGKLYADAQALQQRSLTLGVTSVSTVTYAQTRGDLQRLYLQALLTGMEYHLAAIPPEFPVPASSTDFRREEMNRMFDQGFRLATEGSVWRRTPPGVEPGESMLKRRGTTLMHLPRGKASGLVLDRQGMPLYPAFDASLDPSAHPGPGHQR